MQGSGQSDMQQKIMQMLQMDYRFYAFRDIFHWINYERVEGDILEFGTGSGISLLLFAFMEWYFEQFEPEWWAEWLGDEQNKPFQRKLVGFDAYEGLPVGEGHARWQKGIFKNNEWPKHPFLSKGEPIRPEHVYRLFQECNYQPPTLEVGWFRDTVPACIPSKYNKAAIIHIDSDLYESCKTVLEVIEPVIQTGTIIMFDEWFAFKGDPDKGESLAFNEFLENNPHITARHYKQYALSSSAFILKRTKS